MCSNRRTVFHFGLPSGGVGGVGSRLVWLCLAASLLETGPGRWRFLCGTGPGRSGPGLANHLREGWGWGNGGGRGGSHSIHFLSCFYIGGDGGVLGVPFSGVLFWVSLRGEGLCRLLHLCDVVCACIFFIGLRAMIHSIVSILASRSWPCLVLPS